MKILTKIGLIALTAAIFSCSDSTPDSTSLLAGATGGSKTWKLVTLTQTINGSSALSASFSPCQTDNHFTFSHSANQNYELNEGLTKCSAKDVSTIESGSWSFTKNGRGLEIDSKVYPSSTEFASQYYLAFFVLSGKIITIKKLTSNSLVLSYWGTFPDANGNQLPYVNTYTFVPA